MSYKLKHSDFVGVWQRESISIAGGDAFEDSDVLWLHAGNHFADLRFPLAEKDTATTTAFAGPAHWQSPDMRFEHEVDLTKVFTQDVGSMSFIDAKLIEKGQVTLDAKIIKFEETWFRICTAREEDCRVARNDQTPGYIVQVGDYAVAMQEVENRFSTGRWHFADDRWTLQYEFGDIEAIGTSFHALINDSLQANWQRLV